ncbi:TPR domain protein [Raphidiopsis curvata NIES-932]|nr:TPR domain protein [Raphidiopsis curvata NIES-932]
MYKTFTKAICIAYTTLSIVVLTSPQTLAQNIKSIQNLAKKATVQINTDANPGGSGVIIQKQGETYTVLTANHVVCENLGTTEIRCRTDFNYTIRTYDGREHAIKHRQSLQKTVSDPDLAIVTFESQQDYEVAPIGNFDDVQIQSDILVAGFPTIFGRVGKNRIFTVTNGKVVGFIPDPPKGYGLVYNATTFIGNSGGPVFDSSGNVIGIHGLADTDGVEIDNKNQSETRNGLKPNVSIIRKLINPQVESGTSFIQKTGFNAGIPINIFLSVTADTGLQLPNVKSPVVIPPRRTDQVASEKPAFVDPSVPETEVEKITAEKLDVQTPTLASVPESIEVPTEVDNTANDQLREQQEFALNQLKEKLERLKTSLNSLPQEAQEPSSVNNNNSPEEKSVPALTTPQVVATAEISNYKVKPGDTLVEIAGSYGTSVAELIQANGLSNPHDLRVNQKLIIPQVKSGTGLQQLPTATSKVSLDVQPKAVTIAVPRLTEDGNVSVNSQLGVDAIAPNNEPVNPQFVPGNTRRNPSGIRLNVPPRRMNARDSLGKLRGTTVSPSLPPLAAVDIYLPRNTNETINHNFVPRNTTRNRSGIRSNVPTRKINNGTSLGKLRSRTVSNTKRPNSLNINDAQAYYNRGVARSNLGDKQGAISDFQTAARLYQQQGNQELYRRALNRISQLR